MKVHIYENDEVKMVKSCDYNYIFKKDTGFFARYGKTKEDDPAMAPAPEILDIEISAGKCSGNCPHCYKSNSATAENTWMTLETYKQILDKVSASRILCQVALGVTDIDSNQDLFKIMEYTRSIGIIPNITVNGKNISDDDINKLASLCGAVSVSHYNDTECYGTVQRLAAAMKGPGATLRQVNIHALLCKESLEKCYRIVGAAKDDDRLKDLSAIVLMTLKPKGLKNTMTPLGSLEKFQALFKAAVDAGILIGFDSCGAPQVFRAIENMDMLNIAPSVEGCESSIFSSYINVLGDFFPCSFSEGQGEWVEGISVLKADSFVNDVWHHAKTEAFRNKISNMSKKCNCQFSSQCRPCPLFDITPCYDCKK